MARSNFSVEIGADPDPSDAAVTEGIPACAAGQNRDRTEYLHPIEKASDEQKNTGLCVRNKGQGDVHVYDTAWAVSVEPNAYVCNVTDHDEESSYGSLYNLVIGDHDDDEGAMLLPPRQSKNDTLLMTQI